MVERPVLCFVEDKRTLIVPSDCCPGVVYGALVLVFPLDIVLLVALPREAEDLVRICTVSVVRLVRELYVFPDLLNGLVLPLFYVSKALSNVPGLYPLLLRCAAFIEPNCLEVPPQRLPRTVQLKDVDELLVRVPPAYIVACHKAHDLVTLRRIKRLRTTRSHLTITLTLLFS